MISCVQFIPSGRSDPRPKKYEPSKGEAGMMEAMKEEGEDEAEEEEEEGGEEGEGEELPSDLRMDEYDDEVVDPEILGGDSEMVGTGVGEDGVPVEDLEEMDGEEEEEEEEGGEGGEVEKEGKKEGKKEGSAALIADDNGAGEADETDSDGDSDEGLSEDEFDPLNAEDDREYDRLDVEALSSNIAGSNDLSETEDSDADDSDDDDTNLRPTDVLCMAATASPDDDFSTLQVYVYEPPTGNLYVHHDVTLPSFPLCMAWGDVSAGGAAGSFVAVGTFDCGIEVWNLDVLFPLEPTFTLGGDDMKEFEKKARASLSEKGKKGKKVAWSQQQSSLLPGSHTDAVMCLDWNKVHRQVVASGSADGTVKIWDVTDPTKPAATFTHHKDKVSAVAFHPTDATILASGGFDRTVAVVDCRDPKAKPKTGRTTADVEQVAWNPHSPSLLAAAAEDGSVCCWDVRTMGKKLWAFSSSDCGVADIAFNAQVPGMLAVANVDKTVGVWNVGGDGPPSCVFTKEMGVGKLHTVAFYPSQKMLLSAGGTGGQLGIWELDSEDALVKAFGGARDGPAPAAPAGGEGGGAEEGGTGDVDFEAAMAAGDAAARNAREKAAGGKKGKKGGGKKGGKKGGKAAKA